MKTPSEAKTAKAASEQHHRTDVRPLVSVLCATFNHERYIGPCLDSILAQIASFPIEIIVHDDASTDGTAAIVRAYAEKHPNIIRPILQTENQLSRMRPSRPIMLEHARGAFIAGCDGDDFWLDRQKLTKQVNFLLQNPSFVLSFHDAVHVSADGKLTEAGPVLPKSACRDYTRPELRVLKWGWMLMGTVVHRNVSPLYPHEYNHVQNGDVFTPILLGAFGGAKFQSDVGPLAYRQHPASVMSSKTPKEKKRRVFQSYLICASYLARVGEMEFAEQILSNKLGHPASRSWVEFWENSALS